MLPRVICGGWSLNLNSGFCFFGGTPKNTTTPLALVGWLYGSFLLASSNSRISLSFPTLPSPLIALGIAFARCCIRRWPCFVCMYTLPGLPAGAPRLARVIPNWDKPKRPAGRCRVYCHLYTSYTNPEKHHRGHVGIL